MLVRHVVGHSRPASVSLTFMVWLLVCVWLLFCNKKPFKPRRVCGIALLRGIRFQFLFLTGCFFDFRIRQCHRLSCNRVVRLFMSAAGAKAKETKINLMNCICLCSEVEIYVSL